MDKSEVNARDLCLVCGEFMGIFRRNVNEPANFSKKSISEILDSFISINHIERPSEQNEICQICYIKFNELDEHQTIADKIRLDLSYLYNASHFHSTDILKVKIEPIDVPSPERDDDIEGFESDYNPDRDIDDFDSDSSTKHTESEEIKKKFKPVKISSIKSNKERKPRRTRQKPDISEENIKEHLVNGQIVYQCLVCKKTTSKKGAIRQHVRIHTSERNICCPECGKMFKTPSCLYSHKKIHQKNNRMICDMCGKTFDKKYYLLEHMNAIHLNRREYICTICGITFARKRSLLKHAWVHAGDAEKKIVCSVCGFKSHTKQGMLRHSKTHTGERNYACEICDKRFACKYNVKAHVDAVHKGIRPKVDESKLRCELCGRKFPRQKQLKRHLAEDHNMLQFQNPGPGLNLSVVV
ncbi:hypothetical protein PVAND_015218 [Polypedilum vanderplanki]|uniref:C2H2-type domain-containing protein n=1 Tax=Polypedilum vanderplanki TaxID=319348 RepID=A0A9J6BCF3_POLVA|nr:hypothetical protein PVAND_015218 [Polypedilum vanderplanki]